MSLLEVANTLAVRAGLGYSVSRCDSKFYGDLYYTLTCESFPCIGRYYSEEERCQFLVDSLRRLLPPHLSLQHIQGSNLADGDEIAIRSILDIFAILLESSLDSVTSSSRAAKSVFHSTPCVHFESRVVQSASFEDDRVNCSSKHSASNAHGVLASLYSHYLDDLHALNSTPETAQLKSDIRAISPCE